jgi:hypothetical protein
MDCLRIVIFETQFSSCGPAGMVEFRRITFGRLCNRDWQTSPGVGRM